VITIQAIKLEQKVNNWLSLLKFVSLEKKHKIQRFIHEDDARRSLIAELLVKKMLLENYNLKQIVLRKNAYGKPMIEDPKNIHFNIAHSGCWVVCAFSNSPLGVDIEKIKPIDINIAKDFFSEKEYYSLIKMKKNEQLIHFYDLWTSKESYVKAIGKGLQLALDSFSVQISTNGIKLEDIKDSYHYFFKQYNIDPNYRFTICSSIESFPPRVSIDNEQNLYKFFLHQDQEGNFNI